MTANIESAAQFLIAARKRGTPGSLIPEAFRPTTIDEALAVQRRVTDLVGAAIGGYKCSMPTDPRPVAYAPIFAPTIARSAPMRVRAGAATLQVEPEIACVIGHDLPARATPYSEEDIRDAVKDAHFVLEVLGSRYAEFPNVPFPDNLADGIGNSRPLRRSRSARSLASGARRVPHHRDERRQARRRRSKASTPTATRFARCIGSPTISRTTAPRCAKA